VFDPSTTVFRMICATGKILQFNRWAIWSVIFRASWFMLCGGSSSSSTRQFVSKTWYVKFLFCVASCATATSISPVSPTTGFSVLWISYDGSSVLRRLGHSQNSLWVSSCWWISSPDFSPSFL